MTIKVDDNQVDIKEGFTLRKRMGDDPNTEPFEIITFDAGLNVIGIQRNTSAPQPESPDSFCQLAEK